ncbi:MAG: PilZ domain-containing protein [Proteobacteria bacterium]|nr:MAG: PilZ domain-containing protein [Pseudomonadota bacterium]
MSSVHHPPERSGRASERLRLLTTRLKVYVWQAVDETEPAAGFGLVGDLSPTGLGIFLGHHLPPGTPVRMGLEHVDGLTCRGVVAWCARFSLEQRFKGHDALQYRVGIRCQFGSEAERQRYISYQKELRDRALVIKPER